MTSVSRDVLLENKYVDTEGDVIGYEVNDVTDVAGRVVIVSAEAGMGKSTLLTKLQMGAKGSRWIARINLIERSTQLKWMKSFDERGAVEFLYEAVGFLDETTSEEILDRLTIKDNKTSLEGAGGVIQSSKLLEIAIFNRMYNEGNVTLLFDGFDEISPDYTHKVIELLKLLKDTKVGSMWITTRPYDVRNELENHLSEFSYPLEPLVVDDQKSFLSLFWKKHLKLEELDELRSTVFIDHLLRKFSASSSDRERKFLGVPLQMRMLAQIFQEAFNQFYESNELYLSDEHKKELDTMLNLVTLYETFIFKKFYKIRYAKKVGMNVNIVDIKRTLDDKYVAFEKEHRILALYGLFKEDCLNGLLSEDERNKVNELVQSIRQGVEKTGIINQIIDDRPNFVHRTFAEYFAADWLVLNRKWEKVKSFLRDKLFEDENRALRSFFDRMLIRGDAVKYESHAAVLNGDEGMFRETFSDPLKPKSVDEGGRKPLHVAAAYGYSIMTETLLRYDEDVGTKDDIFGWAHLGYADKGCHWDVAEKLLQKGARGEDMSVAIERVTHVDNAGNTLLHWAAQRGHREFAKVLIGTGKAVVDAVNAKGLTPLHEASKSVSLDMVELLIGNGANLASTVNGNWYGGYRPIHFAAERGNLEVIRFLVDNRNAEFDTCDDNGKTPLLLAAKDGHLDVIKFLIGKGADVRHRVSSDYSHFGKGTILDLITSHYSLVDGWTWVDDAPRELSDVLKIIIRNGLDINVTDNVYGNTILHRVLLDALRPTLSIIVSRILEVLEAFIRNGADGNVKNKRGETPIDLFKRTIVWYKDGFEQDFDWIPLELDQSDFSHLMSVKPIKVAQISDFEQRTIEDIEKLINNTENPLHPILHEASYRGELEVVKYLIERHHVDVNARHHNLNTPLHYAALTEHLGVIEYLIGKGAQVCAKDRGGRVPLHVAALYDNLVAIKCLLDNGADVNVVDNDGLTPLQLALHRGADVQDYLIGRGAIPNDEDCHGGTTPSFGAVVRSVSKHWFFLLFNKADMDIKRKN